MITSPCVRIAAKGANHGRVSAKPCNCRPRIAQTILFWLAGVNRNTLVIQAEHYCELAE